MNLPDSFGLEMWQIDAFTMTAFGGNPAAVVLVQKDDKWMQQVAMENNLAETSFLAKVSDNRFKLRWYGHIDTLQATLHLFTMIYTNRFTPLKEVDLCGHATLAAAHVLITEGFVDSSLPIVFESKSSGELVATCLEEGKLQLSFPATPPCPHHYTAEELDTFKRAFGFSDDDILYTGCTIYDKFFEVTPEAFSRIDTIDFTLVGKFDCRGVIITCAGGKHKKGPSTQREYDVTSRCFFPR
jgi:predicted PhzF superfamily epimerase YddE/YHI9